MCIKGSAAYNQTNNVYCVIRCINKTSTNFTLSKTGVDSEFLVFATLQSWVFAAANPNASCIVAATSLTGTLFQQTSRADVFFVILLNVRIHAANNCNVAFCCNAEGVFN